VICHHTNGYFVSQLLLGLVVSGCSIQTNYCKLNYSIIFIYRTYVLDNIFGGNSMYFYQGKFMHKQDVHISPDDRGYYFGDGVYEVIRIYHGQLFERERHLTRLAQSAAGIRINMPYNQEQLNAILDRLVADSDIQTGNLYMQITRGQAPRSHAFSLDLEAVMLAYCVENERPLDNLNNGISAITMDDTRWLHCNIKALNLIPNVLAKQAAVDQGANEVILHRNGVITEASIANFMVVKNGVLITHPANNLILNGVTRAVALELAAKANIPIQETAIPLAELPYVEEAFVTSTNAEITPVVQIDQQAVGTGEPGPVTRKLQRLFEEYAELG
jgi:D-alanine transaminase